MTSHTGFDDGECNCLMYRGTKEKIEHDIQTTLLNDESLKGYITNDLTLRLLDGYRVRIEYELSCYDDSEQKAGGLSDYCVEGVQSELEKLKYRMESTGSEAEEMDME